MDLRLNYWTGAAYTPTHPPHGGVEPDSAGSDAPPPSASPGPHHAAPHTIDPLQIDRPAQRRGLAGYLNPWQIERAIAAAERNGIPLSAQLQRSGEQIRADPINIVLACLGRDRARDFEDAAWAAAHFERTGSWPSLGATLCRDAVSALPQAAVVVGGSVLLGASARAAAGARLASRQALLMQRGASNLWTYRPPLSITEAGTAAKPPAVMPAAQPAVRPSTGTPTGLERIVTHQVYNYPEPFEQWPTIHVNGVPANGNGVRVVPQQQAPSEPQAAQGNPSKLDYDSRDFDLKALARYIGRKLGAGDGSVPDRFSVRDLHEFIQENPKAAQAQVDEWRHKDKNWGLARSWNFEDLRAHLRDRFATRGKGASW